MRACGGRALLDCQCQKSTHPFLLLQSPAYGQERSSTHASPLCSSKAPARRARSWFMRGVLLRMAEHFNDWDLQAVVRSCGSVAAHPDPAAPRAEPDAAPPEPTTTTPVAAPPERPPGARATPPTPVAVPVPVPVRGQEQRAPPPVAAKAAALLYDLDYLDLDHKPFLMPVVAPSPRAGDNGRGEREVMISFPAGAASTSGMQQRASPPGRKPGARTPRPKRRYRTDAVAVRSNSIHHRVY